MPPSPAAAAAANATISPTTGKNREDQQCNGVVVVDDLTIRRDLCLKSFRGELASLSSSLPSSSDEASDKQKETLATPEWWSESTHVSSLRLPSIMITPRLDSEKTSTSFTDELPSLPSLSATKNSCLFARYESLLPHTFQKRVQILSLEIISKLKSIKKSVEVEVVMPPPHSSVNSPVKLSLARMFVRQGIESLGCFCDIDPSSAVVKMSEWMTGSGDDDWYYGTLALAEECCSRQSGTEMREKSNVMENNQLICRAASSRLCSFEWTLEVAHQVFLLLEHGCVCSIFKMEGISLPFIVHRWLSQCFWNYLPFDVILTYLDLRIQTWQSFATPGRNDDSSSRVDESSIFVAAILEHVVEKYLCESSSKRPPTLSLRDLLVDGPLPSSVATSMWCERKLWDRMDNLMRSKKSRPKK
jgi:hypothetical protein